MFKESGAKHKGLIEMPNLAEENEVDDTEVNVNKKKGDGDILKDLMKTAGTSKVMEALGDYLKALKTGFFIEFTMGMILPTKAMATQDSTVKRKLRENTLQLVQQFSISPAVLEAEKGGKFQIFDGNITGEYIELLTKILS
ncbi:Activator of 90 kDa heat shock protein ATPase homolog 2 [Vulpes lagopus]